MEYIIIDSPKWREFSLIGDQKEMFKNIKKDNFITIDVDKETKTSLSVTMQQGNNRFKGNVFYPNFNFLKRKSYNFFDYQETTSFHFKITKKQGWKEFRDYVETLVKDFLGELPNDFEIRYYNTNALKELAV